MKFNIRINRLCILKCFRERIFIWVKPSIGGKAKSLELNNSTSIMEVSMGHDTLMNFKIQRQQNLYIVIAQN
jgi:hypothetical protein